MAHPDIQDRHQAQRGRGATFNPANRYEATATEVYDDGWGIDPLEDQPSPATVVTTEAARTIVSVNNSPDIGFNQSINPYRGCEHGCVYCYARPTHAYLGMSPGLDFETRIVAKPGAADLLRKKLRGRNYVPQTIAIGANTDAYQPVEREQRVTRGIIEVLAEHKHPFAIITKNQLVLRDLDLLGPLAADNICRVMVSITTLDPRLSRVMEPRASHPEARLRTVEQLSSAGVSVGVMVAPLIPAINDHELERILEAVAARGAQAAGYVALRLPLELKELFEGWLQTHFPDRKDRVLDLVRQMRGGRLYDAQFGQRQRGTGTYAQLLQARFKAALARHELDRPLPLLSAAHFRVPPQPGEQLGLF